MLTSKGKWLGRPPAEDSSFSYTLRKDHGINVKVCQKALSAEHEFGSKRLQVLRWKIQGASVQPQPTHGPVDWETEWEGTGMQ